MTLRRLLGEIVGAANVLTAPEDTKPYYTDWRRQYHAAAECVVRPGSTAEVAAIVALCGREGAAIVPQGGNTGLVGGSVPTGTRREVVLSLARMNRIRAVDPLNDTATVEAGCVLAGDEVGNSQGGNNNAYCQDNEIGWVDWSGLDDPARDIGRLIERLATLRKSFPQLRPRHWVEDWTPDSDRGVKWRTTQAKPMTEQDWHFPEGRFLAYVLGPLAPDRSPLCIVLNAAAQPIERLGEPPRRALHHRVWLAVRAVCSGASRTLSTSLSPRPDRLTMSRSSRSMPAASRQAWAMAWEDSSAGIIPSVRERYLNPSSASVSVTFA